MMKIKKRDCVFFTHNKNLLINFDKEILFKFLTTIKTLFQT